MVLLLNAGFIVLFNAYAAFFFNAVGFGGMVSFEIFNGVDEFGLNIFIIDRMYPMVVSFYRDVRYDGLHSIFKWFPNDNLNKSYCHLLLIGCRCEGWMSSNAWHATSGRMIRVVVKHNPNISHLFDDLFICLTTYHRKRSINKEMRKKMVYNILAEKIHYSFLPLIDYTT